MLNELLSDYKLRYWLSELAKAEVDLLGSLLSPLSLILVYLVHRLLIIINVQHLQIDRSPTATTCSVVFQYLCDGGGAQRTLPVPTDPQDGSLGEEGFHTHSATTVSDAAASVPIWAQQVRRWNFLGQVQDIHYMTIKLINKRRSKYIQFKCNYYGL
jgi:hypothetical protein